VGKDEKEKAIKIESEVVKKPKIKLNSGNQVVCYLTCPNEKAAE
jgi:hypothetical protein